VELIGKTADELLEKFGRPLATWRVGLEIRGDGSDIKSGIVKWSYRRFLLTLRVREKDGIWAYRVTEVDDPLPSKIGRNDPCPCQSGKKYKRCCLEEA
jgi:hypothetical protein